MRATKRPSLLIRAADLLDRFAAPLYLLALASFAVLFALAARFFTLEADEAWILLSTAYTFGVPVGNGTPLPSPTVTTGGIHLLLHGLLDGVTMDVLAHRAVSLLATGVLLVFVYRLLRTGGAAAAVAVAGTAFFASTPGFIFQASLATGEVLATLLLLLATYHWTRRGRHAAGAAVLTGVLLGLACATRINCLVAAPAIVTHTLLWQGLDRRTLFRSLLAAGLCLALAGFAVEAYKLAGQAAIGRHQAEYLALSTGVGARKPVGKILEYVGIVNQFVPAAVIATLVGAWLVRWQAGGGRERRPVLETAGLAILIGLAMCAAWVLFSPIPHLRYLWPALACLWFAGSLLLVDWWRDLGGSPARLAVHLAVATTCGYALLASALAVAQGESLTLVYQASGESPRLSLPGSERFRAAADQQALATFVGGRPLDARFIAYRPPVSFPVGYLAHRRIDSVASIAPRGEQYLLLAPADYAVWRLDPRFDVWRRDHATLAFRRGGFAAFRIGDGAPVPPGESNPLGRNDYF